MTDRTTLRATIMAILVQGLTPDAVADAIVEAVCPSDAVALPPSEPLAEDDPAVTGVPRDETVDSIDQATGTLTDEAVAARAKLADDQAAESAAKDKADAADAALSQAQDDDKSAHAELDADNAAVSQDEMDLGGDTGTAGADTTAG